MLSFQTVFSINTLSLCACCKDNDDFDPVKKTKKQTSTVKKSTGPTTFCADVNARGGSAGLRTMRPSTSDPALLTLLYSTIIKFSVLLNDPFAKADSMDIIHTRGSYD